METLFNSAVNQNDASNDGIGENTEQTELAKEVSIDRKQESQQNSRPDVQTVTPERDNGEAGPGARNSQLWDDAQENYSPAQETQENSAWPDDEESWGDDDKNDGDKEDDYITSTDDDDDELIPIEDDDLDDNDDDDDDDDGDDDELDPLADRPTTFSVDADFTSRPHGRTTGTMVDHEPGLPGPIGGRQ